MKAYESVNGKPRRYDVLEQLPPPNRYICVMDFDNRWQALIKSSDFLTSLKNNWLITLRREGNVKIIPARDITHWMLFKNREDVKEMG